MTEIDFNDTETKPELEFKKAYNYFDPKPLEIKQLEEFYIEYFSQSAVKELKTTIDITEKYRKLLVVGHRGCGKSTVLNKICQDIQEKKNQYTIVAFSASDVVNISEIEAIDILFAIYFRVFEKTLQSDSKEQLDKINKQRPNDNIGGGTNLLPNASKVPVKEELESSVATIPIIKNQFQELFKKLSIPIGLSDVNVSLLGLISFKYKVESETRSNVRIKLKEETKELQRNIKNACDTLKSITKKETIIIIDDLDKLSSDVAKNIFFKNYNLLSDTPSKVIYTFPLDVYYEPEYNKYSDLYDEIFIPICNLTDIAGNERYENKNALFEMVYKRIDKKLVSPIALSYLIDMSGGLLRDLVKFMQDACKFAIMDKINQITEDIAKKVVERKINAIDRVFDSIKYKEVIFEIERDHHSISKEHLVYLLHNLFVREYREGSDVWYIIHPCLKKALTSSKEKKGIPG